MNLNEFHGVCPDMLMPECDFCEFRQGTKDLDQRYPTAYLGDRCTCYGANHRHGSKCITQRHNLTRRRERTRFKIIYTGRLQPVNSVIRMVGQIESIDVARRRILAIQEVLPKGE